MQAHIKAIETRYKGYRFRSRLEARWAVFFDALGMEWKYEVQGYRISNGNKSWNYLPDFYLPNEKCWVEVKGDMSKFDAEMYTAIMSAGGQLPDVANSDGTTRGILVLSDIPQSPSASTSKTSSEIVSHPIIQHFHDCAEVNSAFFGLPVQPQDSTDYGSSFNPTEFDPGMKRSTLVVDDLTPRDWNSGCFEENEIIEIGDISDTDKLCELWWYGIKISPVDLWNCAENQRPAYTAARSARFEHGERG